MAKPTHAPGSAWCECPTCGQGFGGVTLFDAHRVGPIGKRRCLSTQEMFAKGWRLDGYLWRANGGYRWGANSPETPEEASADGLVVEGRI